MTDKMKHQELQPEPALDVLDTIPSGIKIGIAANYRETEETRMLLTPEACGVLTSGGFVICMEEGAGVDVSFSDDKYASYGVKIVSRDEALKCPIVLSYSPLKTKDIKKMEKGASLLCMMGDDLFDSATIKALLERHITTGVLDNMISHNDEAVFANIIDEIDGRAAIMYAEDALSYLGGGKGVLLAGVAGINPCEILLIGIGNEILHAAKAAVAAGARVTLMDNDISSLMAAKDICGPLVDTVAIHPHVLLNKVKSADVIITSNTTRPFDFPKNLSEVMKENVYVLDLNDVHPSVCVPRTVAMALSNVLVNFFGELALKTSFNSMIATTPGVQCGIVTYNGKLVDKLIGSFLSMPSVDISVMLSGSTN